MREIRSYATAYFIFNKKPVFYTPFLKAEGEKPVHFLKN